MDAVTEVRPMTPVTNMLHIMGHTGAYYNFHNEIFSRLLFVCVFYILGGG